MLGVPSLGALDSLTDLWQDVWNVTELAQQITILAMFTLVSMTIWSR